MMDKKLPAAALAFLIVLAAALLYWHARADHGPGSGGTAKLNVESVAFKEGDRIPAKYTCDGGDTSPSLSWDPGPAGTASYALIVYDPDAPGGPFTHWLAYNIPANVTRLGEHVAALDRLEDGTLQGKNHFGRTGYGGPCPPPGSTHRYRFGVYALDTRLSLDPGTATRESLTAAMKGHVLAQGELTGVYGR